MNRRNSVTVFALLLLILLLSLSSCGGSGTDPYPMPGPEDPPNSPDLPEAEDIYLPDSGDLGRETVNFDELVYERPDVDALLADCNRLVSGLGTGISADELETELVRLLEAFESFDSMLSLAMIRYTESTGSIAASVEYRYLQSRQEEVDDAYLGVCRAVAGSEHRLAMEERVFGEGYLKSYEYGGEELEELLLAEASLEEQYRSSSEDEADRIFVELVKIRYRIAHACGYTSYTSYAYDMLGRDFSPVEAEKFIRDVANYIMPVYVALSNSVFYSYFGDKTPESLDYRKAVNTLRDVFAECDSDLSDVYDFMLSFRLYNIEPPSEGRSSTNYVSYINENASPFLFMTPVGNITDYMTLASSFGTYFDRFANYGNEGDPALDCASSALPMLILTRLDGLIPDSEYRYLYYYQMHNLLTELVLEAYCAKFEIFVYRLPYDKITSEAIDELADEAADAMYLITGDPVGLSYVLNDRVVLEPHTSVADCISSVLALETYFSELQEEGSGFKALKSLTARILPRSFSEKLQHAGIDSPLDRESLKKVANSVHYRILGYHYFEEFGSDEPDKEK